MMGGTFAGSMYRSDHLGVMSIFTDETNATTEVSQVPKKPFKIYKNYPNPYSADSLI